MTFPFILTPPHPHWHRHRTDEAFKATNRFQWAEAEKAWTKVLELDSGNAAAYSNRGNTRTSMGKCVEAVSDFNKAIELAPKEPDPNLGRGVARECLGQFKEALDDYAEANKKNLAMTGQEDPVTYNNRGKQGERKDSGSGSLCFAWEIRTQIKTSINHLTTTHTHAANAEAGLGDYAAALDDYRKAAKMQPGYVFPLASAALMLYQLVRLNLVV